MMLIHQLRPGLYVGLWLGWSVIANSSPLTCHYHTYKWNVRLKQAVDIQQVTKPYAQLLATEIDPLTGCTVCEEDQVSIRLAGIEPFKVCRLLAVEIEHTLRELLQQGEPIYDVVGYRVGMTKGPVDEQGNRTRFSYHSYGIALDINTEHNGLYENCQQIGPWCRLRKGGQWSPEQPGSLTGDSATVRALKQTGLKWGGEIHGNQKDFMHFSPYGY